MYICNCKNSECETIVVYKYYFKTAIIIIKINRERSSNENKFRVSLATIHKKKVFQVRKKTK